jgi:hypothetical protein
VKNFVNYALVGIREKKKCRVRCYGKRHLSEFIEIEVYSIPHGVRDMVVHAFCPHGIVFVISHDDGGTGALPKNTALLHL